jgi:hypothetical protein
LNFQETIALIDALKSSGVTKYKSSEHEIELSLGVVSVKKTEPVPDTKSVEATEKLKNLINTISMSPEELADKMFPAGAL